MDYYKNVYFCSFIQLKLVVSLYHFICITTRAKLRSAVRYIEINVKCFQTYLFLPGIYEINQKFNKSLKLRIVINYRHVRHIHTSRNRQPISLEKFNLDKVQVWPEAWSNKTWKPLLEWYKSIPIITIKC